MQNLISKAVLKRKPLSLITNAMRLVNGKGDGMDGLLIDRYNAHVQIQILDDVWQKHLPQIQQALTAHFPVEYMIVKSRQSTRLSSTTLCTSNTSQTIVHEHNLKFAVDLNDGLNCGLFLDMRANRHLVGKFCKGKKVLNCFAYTCSFGVHARAHGAKEVINVDISQKILERGRANYELNNLPTGPHEFANADSMSFLTRAVKKGNRFDTIILDPPSFARHEGKVFQVKRDLPKLIATAAASLNPKGILFVSTNSSEITHAKLEQMLPNPVSKIHSIQRLTQDTDFPGTNTFKESHLAALLVRF